MAAATTDRSAVGAISDALKRLTKERDDLDKKRGKVNAEIERHERAKRLLTEGKSSTGRKRTPSKARSLNPATVAGPKALKTTEEFLSDIGVAPQSEITKGTKLNSGSVSYALRALEAEGKVRKTGEQYGRSPVWEHVNGRARSTKVAPGT